MVTSKMSKDIEQNKLIEKNKEQLSEHDKTIALILERIDRMFDMLEHINEKLDHQYVTVTEYTACKTDFEKRISKIESSFSKIVWFIVLSVLGALIGLVIKTNV